MEGGKKFLARLFGVSRQAASPEVIGGFVRRRFAAAAVPHVEMQLKEKSQRSARRCLTLTDPNFRIKKITNQHASYAQCRQKVLPVEIFLALQAPEPRHQQTVRRRQPTSSDVSISLTTHIHTHTHSLTE